MSSLNLCRRSVLAQGLALGAVASTADAQSKPHTHDIVTKEVRHKTADVDGVRVFYREAGPADAPALLLLHGFANSSHYFRHLMPRLADRYRTIAPDMPSFGFTEVPQARNYQYSFAGLTNTMSAFVDAIGLTRFGLYAFDYGGPVGFNLALERPERITGIISQNGNAYEAGLGEKAWAPVRALWKNRSAELEDIIAARFSFDGVHQAYFAGMPRPDTIEPEAYWLDAAILAKPGNRAIQLDLKYDYRSNVDRYPRYQAYFREHRPPLLAIWGRNDPFFIPPGAEAFRRDIPDAEVRLLDAGHFALESNLDDIASAIRSLHLQI